MGRGVPVVAVSSDAMRSVLALLCAAALAGACAGAGVGDGSRGLSGEQLVVLLQNATDDPRGLAAVLGHGE